MYPLNDEQLLRYSRQLLMPDFAIDDQVRLSQARVLIIGLGGLGSPVSLYLAAAGIGHLSLVDDDHIELSNLARQILFSSDDIDKAKVAAGKNRLERLNPDLTITPWEQRADRALLDRLLPEHDLVLDCCDNFSTRVLLNQACLHHGIPWLSASAVGTAGHLMLFDARDRANPCYECLYPEPPKDATTCTEHGVFGPVLGVLGSFQAMHTIQWLLKQQSPLANQLVSIDCLIMQLTSMTLRRETVCPLH